MDLKNNNIYVFLFNELKTLVWFFCTRSQKLAWLYTTKAIGVRENFREAGAGSKIAKEQSLRLPEDIAKTSIVRDKENSILLVVQDMVQDTSR